MELSFDATLVNRAKSLVAQWYDDFYDDTHMRVHMLNGVEAVARTLDQRHHWHEVYTIGLDGGGHLDIEYDTSDCRVYPSGNYLAVSTIVPGWARGWRDVLEAEEVRETLSWFLHYSQQYIHRSHVARALMIAWESASTILHPFGSRGLSRFYGPIVPFVSSAEALDTAQEEFVADTATDRSAGSGTIPKSTWLQHNTLDPFIHQGVFHFLRAQDLRTHGFDLEACVALGCVIESAKDLVKTRNKKPTTPSLEKVCSDLELAREHEENLRHVSFVRNNIGAHAGGWRWWDAHEVLEEEVMEQASLSVSAALCAIASYEEQVREVDPTPTNWVEWFFRHFDLLWNTVWIDRSD